MRHASRATVGSASVKWLVETRQWQGARSYQEDSFEYRFLGDEPDGGEGAPPLFMVLADGMGGEAGGAQASHWVVEAFMRHFTSSGEEPAARLATCLDIANRGLRAWVEADPQLDGMGSTVVAVFHDGWNLFWLSVGDSPMWWFANGRLTRLNADHSMTPILERMARLGDMTLDQARTDPRRHMLRSAVTGSEVDLVDRAHRACRLGPGDFLLLASDGLETLDEREIERRLDRADGDAETAADSLMRAVRDADRPGQDNVTFLLLAAAGDPQGRMAHREDSAQPLMRLPTGRESVTAGGWKRKPGMIRGGLAALGVAMGLGVGLAWGLWWGSSGPEPVAAVDPPAAGEPPKSSRPPEVEAGGGDEDAALPGSEEAPPEAGSESRTPLAPEPSGERGPATETAAADPAESGAPAQTPGPPVAETSGAGVEETVLPGSEEAPPEAGSESRTPLAPEPSGERGSATEAAAADPAESGAPAQTPGTPVAETSGAGVEETVRPDSEEAPPGTRPETPARSVSEPSGERAPADDVPATDSVEPETPPRAPETHLSGTGTDPGIEIEDAPRPVSEETPLEVRPGTSARPESESPDKRLPMADAPISGSAEPARQTEAPARPSSEPPVRPLPFAPSDGS